MSQQLFNYKILNGVWVPDTVKDTDDIYLSLNQMLYELYAGAGGAGSIDFRDNFDVTMAKMNMTPYRNFQFGTAAVAPAGGIAIRNLGDLATYFNDFEDGTGTNVINSELQTYVAFNSVNHAFTTDRLNLTAALPASGVMPGGQWPAFVTGAVGTVNLNGTANPIANLGLITTALLQVGQVVAVQFKGIYWINAIVADTSVSLTALNNSSVTAQTNNLIAWLPIFSMALNATVNSGTTVLPAAAVPAGVQVGMTMAYANTGTSGNAINKNLDYRVIAADATTVTIAPALSSLSIASGQRVLFSAPITSAQIWSKVHYPLSNSGVFFAAEATLDLGDGRASANYDIHLVSTKTNFDLVPTDFPWGYFTGYWAYAGTDTGAAFSHNSAEMDFFEVYLSTTVGPNRWFGNNSSGGGEAVLYRNYSANGWTDGGSGFAVSPPGTTLMGRHKFQFIYANGRTYRYFDGRIMQYDNYTWSSGQQPQWGLNIVAGSIQAGFAGNFMFPMAATNFANFTYGVENAKIWYSLPSNAAP